MKKNLEIKTSVDSFTKIRQIIISEKFSTSVELQKDIYYKVSTGRLKLRIINNETGNLIYYNRSDKNSIRTSNYLISSTNEFKELDKIMRSQFHLLLCVDKKREVFIKKNIRIHLDTVVRLGKFLEIEIIYSDFPKAKATMNNLISKLELNKTNFIKRSYSDLLTDK
ncbi:MAG: class IV adenylate cyclase [bacterium]